MVLGSGSMSMMFTSDECDSWSPPSWDPEGWVVFNSDLTSSNISPSSPGLIHHLGSRQLSIASGTLLPHIQSVVHSTMVLFSVHFSRILANPEFCWNLHLIPSLHWVFTTLTDSCLHSKVVVVFLNLFAVM